MIRRSSQGVKSNQIYTAHILSVQTPTRDTPSEVILQDRGKVPSKGRSLLKFNNIGRASRSHPGFCIVIDHSENRETRRLPTTLSRRSSPTEKE